MFASLPRAASLATRVVSNNWGLRLFSHKAKTKKPKKAQPKPRAKATNIAETSQQFVNNVKVPPQSQVNIPPSTEPPLPVEPGSREISLKLPPDFDVNDLRGLSTEEILKLLNIDPASLHPDTNISIDLSGLNEDQKRQEAEEKKKKGGIELVESTWDPNDPRKPPPGRNSVNMLRGAKVRSMKHKGRMRVIRRVKSQYDHTFTHGRDMTRQVMKLLGFGHFDLAVTLVTAKGMRDLNRKYRNVDAPTDVLSFGMDTPADEGVPVEFGDIADLGELVICVPYAHCMAALRLPHLRKFDEREHIYGSEHMLPDVPEAQLVEDESFMDTDALLDVNIDPDARPLEELTLTAEEMDSISAPMTALYRHTDTLTDLPPTLAPGTVDDEGYSRTRVREEELEKLWRMDGVNLDTVDVVYERNGKNYVKSLVASQPALYKKLLSHVVFTPTTQPGNYNYVNPDAAHVDAGTVTVDASAARAEPEGTVDLGEAANAKGEKDGKEEEVVEKHPTPEWLSRVTVGMLEDELPVLVVHGVLHLLGYDHHTKEKRDRMQAKTDWVMNELYRKGYITKRALLVSRYYVLDNVETEAEIRELYGEDAVASSTGDVFKPDDIMYTGDAVQLISSNSDENDKIEIPMPPKSIIPEGGDENSTPINPYQPQVDVTEIARDIEANDELKRMLVDAGVDMLDEDGNVSLDKLRVVDWQKVSQYAMDHMFEEGIEGTASVCEDEDIKC